MTPDRTPGYCGRFAPSPTGPLHAGSLVAALASWLDARAQGGRWLVRIEDVDRPRCQAGMDTLILQQLAALGLHPDATPVYQSQQAPAYQAALETLKITQWAYPCGCSRKGILTQLARQGTLPARGQALVYPGTCRVGRVNPVTPAWRFRTDRGLTPEIHWVDRRLGPQSQRVEAVVGDFPLLRADACFTYQLAVVVDDAEQGVTDVVRGEDLADNTARQILLQQALGLPRPRYLHLPLVYGTDGEKLSKQNAATALDLLQPLATLNEAANVLGLSPRADTTLGAALSAWVLAWRQLYNLAGD